MWRGSFCWITWMKMSWTWACVTSPGSLWRSWWVALDKAARSRLASWARSTWLIDPDTKLVLSLKQRWVQYCYAKLGGHNCVQDFWNLKISTHSSAESVQDFELVYRQCHTLLVWTSDLLRSRKGLRSRRRNFRCQGFQFYIMAYTFLKSLSFHMQAQVPRGTKLDLSQNQLVTLPVSVVLSQSAASLILRPHTGLGLSESNPCRGLCG